MTDHEQSPRSRRGFTLIETMIALVILAGVVLTMAMGTTKLTRSVANSNGRNRAQSVADMQVGRARVWPTYATLSQLAGITYNGTKDGLVSSTSVVVDTTSGINVTRVTVTVAGEVTGTLATPVVRSITVAAP